jgi:hypothetical protein
MTECDGWVLPARGVLIPCESRATEAVGDLDLCYFHAKVARGEITTIDGKRDLAWMPKHRRPSQHAGPYELLKDRNGNLHRFDAEGHELAASMQQIRYEWDLPAAPTQR